MIDKDDLDVSTSRVLDRLEAMDRKLDRLLQLGEISGEQTFDMQQAADLICVSKVTLWRYCNKGLKWRRGTHGKRTFILSDIRAFLNGRQ